MQDEKFNLISKWNCYEDEEDYQENGKFLRYIRIPDSITAFRLVFITADGKATYIPNSIRIEQSE
jgi:hypothetical protein